MLDRIILQIALALFAFLEKRMEKGSTAIDSQDDRNRLIAAGNKLDAWMQQQNGSSVGGQSVPSGTTLQSKDLHSDRGTVESQR
jgi:hypothetical protein